MSLERAKEHLKKYQMENRIQLFDVSSANVELAAQALGCEEKRIAKTLSFEEVEQEIGHAVGGVCPFGVKEGVTVYLDESLKRFQTVFPACGTGNSAIELTIPELEQCSESSGWVDVCKGWV